MCMVGKDVNVNDFHTKGNTVTGTIVSVNDDMFQVMVDGVPYGITTNRITVACDVCGKEMSWDDLYVCVNTGDVCCDSHCIYDDESNGYIKAL